MPYSEQTALTNLAVTPGKIIATDVAAIQNLASDFGASTLSVNKVVATAPGGQHAQAQGSNRPGQHGCGPEGQGRDSRFGDACPPRAKANDNNPVSTAIKAIKEASKGSYVGRHCADAAGAKASAHNGEDGSKGSNGSNARLREPTTVTGPKLGPHLEEVCAMKKILVTLATLAVSTGIALAGAPSAQANDDGLCWNGWIWSACLSGPDWVDWNPWGNWGCNPGHGCGDWRHHGKHGWK